MHESSRVSPSPGTAFLSHTHRVSSLFFGPVTMVTAGDRLLLTGGGAKKTDFDPTSVTGVLCRFAINSLMPALDSRPLERFSEAERIATLLAPLRMIHSSCWINDPWVEERADCRVFQAFLARSLGLNVP